MRPKNTARCGRRVDLGPSKASVWSQWQRTARCYEASQGTGIELISAPRRNRRSTIRSWPLMAATVSAVTPLQFWRALALTRPEEVYNDHPSKVCFLSFLLGEDIGEQKTFLSHNTGHVYALFKYQ